MIIELETALTTIPKTEQGLRDLCTKAGGSLVSVEFKANGSFDALVEVSGKTCRVLFEAAEVIAP